MQISMMLGVFDWMGEFFKSLFDVIPKVMYLLYASFACVMDLLQLFFRKLAGLDVYYVDGKPVSGDIVTHFITGILGINAQEATYPALATVFWSMVVFGVIMCFACTIVAIIKSHYSYDEKSAKGPMQFVYTAGKSIINMVAAPVIIVLALFVSEAILTALDTITSVSNGTVVSMYGQTNVNAYLVGSATSASVDSTNTNSNEITYINYDIFGFAGGVQYGTSKYEPISGITYKDVAKVGSRNQTFSGSLFKVAAYNANRVRIGEYNIDSKVTGFRNSYGGYNGKKMLLFQDAKDNDELADMIDTAFACRLQLNGFYWLDYPDDDVAGNIASMKYFTTFLSLVTSAFSKFNVGLVWYYYDLWQFNFVVGFAGILVCVSFFLNIILGLMTRLFMCIGLFLVSPACWGLAPLDGGKAGKSFKENFTKQVLMAYGAVVGMNLMLMILPYMNEISFFNIGIADYFANSLIIIVGLITIKAFISTFSALAGGADANDTGDKIKGEVGKVTGQAVGATIGAAKLGGKAWNKTTGNVMRAQNKLMNSKFMNTSHGFWGSLAKGTVGVLSGGFALKGAQKFGKGIVKSGAHIFGGKNRRERRQLEGDKRIDDFLSGYDGMTADKFDEKEFEFNAKKAGMNGGEIKHMKTEMKKKMEAGGSLDMGFMRDEYQSAQSSHRKHGTYGANLYTIRDKERYDKRISELDKKVAGEKKLKVAKFLGSHAKSAVSGIQQTTKFMWENSFKGNDFIDNFLDKSGISKKPNWERDTATNTGELATQVKSLSTSTQDLTKGVGDLNTTTKIVQLQSQIESLTRQKAELTKNRRKAKRKAAEISRLQNEIDKLNKEIGELSK